MSLFDGIIFGLIIALMATMDYYNFKRPHDNGFWSLKTKAPRWDVWHVSKRIIIFLVAFLAIGLDKLIEIATNPYLQAMVIAFVGQAIFYTLRR